MDDEDWVFVNNNDHESLNLSSEIKYYESLLAAERLPAISSPLCLDCRSVRCRTCSYMKTEQSLTELRNDEEILKNIKTVKVGVMPDGTDKFAIHVNFLENSKLKLADAFDTVHDNRAQIEASTIKLIEKLKSLNLLPQFMDRVSDTQKKGAIALCDPKLGGDSKKLYDSMDGLPKTYNRLNLALSPSKSTAVRLLNDTTTKGIRNISINQCMADSSKLLNNLSSVYRVWAFHEFCLSADISKCFYSVYATPNWNSVRRLIWFLEKDLDYILKNPPQNYKHKLVSYVYKVISMGDKLSPSVIEILLKRIVAEFLNSSGNEASGRVLAMHRLIDDIKTSSRTKEERDKIVKDILFALQKFSFKVKECFLERQGDILTNKTESEEKEVQESSIGFGLEWNFTEDVCRQIFKLYPGRKTRGANLGETLEQTDLNQIKIGKEFLARIIGEMFDLSFRFSGIFVVAGKELFSRLCSIVSPEKSGWKEIINKTDHPQLTLEIVTFCREIIFGNKNLLPFRRYCLASTENIKRLLVLTDGGGMFYSAWMAMVVQDERGTVSTQLIMGKNKTSKASIPENEYLGKCLGVQMSAQLVAEVDYLQTIELQIACLGDSAQNSFYLSETHHFSKPLMQRLTNEIQRAMNMTIELNPKITYLHGWIDGKRNSADFLSKSFLNVNAPVGHLTEMANSVEFREGYEEYKTDTCLKNIFLTVTKDTYCYKPLPISKEDKLKPKVPQPETLHLSGEARVPSMDDDLLTQYYLYKESQSTDDPYLIDSLENQRFQEEITLEYSQLGEKRIIDPTTVDLDTTIIHPTSSASATNDFTIQDLTKHGAQELIKDLQEHLYTLEKDSENLWLNNAEADILPQPLPQSVSEQADPTETILENFIPQAERLHHNLIKRTDLGTAAGISTKSDRDQLSTFLAENLYKEVIFNKAEKAKYDNLVNKFNHMPSLLTVVQYALTFVTRCKKAFLDKKVCEARSFLILVRMSQQFYEIPNVNYGRINCHGLLFSHCRFGWLDQSTLNSSMHNVPIIDSKDRLTHLLTIRAHEVSIAGILNCRTARSTFLALRTGKFPILPTQPNVSIAAVMRTCISCRQKRDTKYFAPLGRSRSVRLLVSEPRPRLWEHLSADSLGPFTLQKPRCQMQTRNSSYEKVFVLLIYDVVYRCINLVELEDYSFAAVEIALERHLTQNHQIPSSLTVDAAATLGDALVGPLLTKFAIKHKGRNFPIPAVVAVAAGAQHRNVSESRTREIKQLLGGIFKRRDLTGSCIVPRQKFYLILESVMKIVNSRVYSGVLKHDSSPLCPLDLLQPSQYHDPLSILEYYGNTNNHDDDMVGDTLSFAVEVLKQSIFEEYGFNAKNFQGNSKLRGGISPKENDLVIYSPRESFFKRAVVIKIISPTNIKISLLVIRNTDGSGILGTRVVHPSQLALLHRPGESEEYKNATQGMNATNPSTQQQSKLNKDNSMNNDAELIYQIYLGKLGIQKLPHKELDKSPDHSPDTTEREDINMDLYLPTQTPHNMENTQLATQINPAPNEPAPAPPVRKTKGKGKQKLPNPVPARQQPSRQSKTKFYKNLMK